MHRESLSEDILRQARASDPSQEYSDDIFNEALILMEDLCMSINNKALCQLGMPAPTRDRNAVQDRDLMREQQFDANQLERFVQTQKEFLVADQKKAYDKIMQRVTKGDGGIIFLDAPGVTGKTFLINLILASVRMRNGIAVAVASSGIASTLLDGGRTAYSALKLPLNLHQTETPTCNISKNSGMAIVLKSCKIIIWDECTMAHKKSLEALDRTLRDFRGKDQPMGGALILLAGDFRQTLPVIPRSTPADELNACLKASHLWNYVEKITLTTNMRVHLLQDTSAQIFSKQLLDIGNGKVHIDRTTNEISFPSNFCQMQQSIQDVIDRVFPNLTINYRNPEWLRERAILAPKNDDVSKLNGQIQLKIPGEAVEYKSIDTVMDKDQAVNYPTEFPGTRDSH
ncbi:ATP-dependent DNA helicase pif1-like [Rhagoletis pomonella]|uniref:ATP-dependent DNA helicase pif1-like n=1 Tax=Rhagoletis pomonella TaxID=28610 RepID=UPI00177FEFFC|nr:ATP-dependent DNA helicase pif1-like [Rhagoletis pomonella]